MPESWFELSSADQSEALEVAAGRSGRPAHLLEKDIWVIYVRGCCILKDSFEPYTEFANRSSVIFVRTANGCNRINISKCSPF